jgi:hypothetical protein
MDSELFSAPRPSEPQRSDEPNANPNSANRRNTKANGGLNTNNDPEIVEQLAISSRSGYSFFLIRYNINLIDIYH